VAGRLDVRAFGGDEDLVYPGLGLRAGIGRNVEAMIRGSFTDRKSLGLPGGGSIRHGGSDVELALRFGWERPDATASSASVAGLIGVSFPSTPAQDDAVLTLGASLAVPAGERIQLFVNPRAAFIEDNTLFGIGLGATARLGDRVSLVGDYTPLLSGDNTRDTTTGGLKRRDVWGAAIRFGSADDRVLVDLGYTNAVGFTTGFSLTPGLGGSGAFYLSVRARR
jgi:hypothetical protein